VSPCIVSLLPALTETVCALGRLETLVGRSHLCNYPAEVMDVPALTSARGAPDEAKTLLAESLAPHPVELGKLRVLAPTHVLARVRPQSPAIALEDVEAALAHLMGGRARLVALDPASLEDVLFDLERVGEAIGAADEALLLVASLRDRFQEIAACALKTDSRPLVAVLEGPPA